MNLYFMSRPATSSTAAPFEAFSVLFGVTKMIIARLKSAQLSNRLILLLRQGVPFNGSGRIFFGVWLSAEYLRPELTATITSASIDPLSVYYITRRWKTVKKLQFTISSIQQFSAGSLSGSYVKSKPVLPFVVLASPSAKVHASHTSA
jgi:hypothetical protein